MAVLHLTLTRFLGPSGASLRALHVSEPKMTALLRHVPYGPKSVTARELAQAMGKSVLNNSDWAAIYQLGERGDVAWSCANNPEGHGYKWSFARNNEAQKARFLRKRKEAVAQHEASKIIPL